MKFWSCAVEFRIYAILATVTLVKWLSEVVSAEDLVDCGVYIMAIRELSSSCFLEYYSFFFKIQVIR